jgi:hypothetical protein
MNDGRTRGRLAEKTTCSSKRGMLVLGACKSYVTEKVKTVTSDLLNTDLMVTPGGMTDQLLVLDVVVNEPLKD